MTQKESEAEDQRCLAERFPEGPQYDKPCEGEVRRECGIYFCEYHRREYLAMSGRAMGAGRG